MPHGARTPDQQIPHRPATHLRASSWTGGRWLHPRLLEGTGRRLPRRRPRRRALLRRWPPAWCALARVHSDQGGDALRGNRLRLVSFPRVRQQSNCLAATPPPTAPGLGRPRLLRPYHLRTLLVIRGRSVPTISARAHAAATAVGFSRLALHVRLGTYTTMGLLTYGHAYCS
eukprot:scaffold46885_cov58-Phaeocystis_antarctica.AAC.4